MNFKVVDSMGISPIIADDNDDDDATSLLQRGRREVSSEFNSSSFLLSDGHISAKIPHNIRISDRLSVYKTTTTTPTKRYKVQSYRIRSGHQIAIAIPFKHIKNKNVYVAFASFAADKGTSGLVISWKLEMYLLK